MSKAIVSLSGTVGKNAEIRATNNGSMANFSVATNSRQKDRDGNWGDATTWWEVTVFSKSDDWLRNNFFKGAKVFVSGEVTNNQWQDREGQTRSSLRVTANHAEGLTRQTEPRTSHDRNPPASSAEGNDFSDEIPF